MSFINQASSKFKKPILKKFSFFIQNKKNKYKAFIDTADNLYKTGVVMKHNNDIEKKTNSYDSYIFLLSAYTYINSIPYSKNSDYLTYASIISIIKFNNHNKKTQLDIIEKGIQIIVKKV